MAVGTSLSTYAANLVLNKLFRNVDFSVTSWYAGLLVATVPSSDTGTFVECTGTGYARKTITFGAPASSQVRNNILVDWGTLSAAWGQLYGVIITDAVSLDTYNMLAYGAIANGPKAMNAGQNPRISVNALTVLVD